MRSRRAYWALNGCLGLCIALSWGAVYGLELTAPVPLGLCPVLLLAGTVSLPALICCMVVILALYVWTFFSLRAVLRRKRFGTVSLVVLVTLDAAANGVFTVTSWWYLLAVALDLLLLLLAYRMYRWAGEEA